jgi:hypothetical protein
MGYSTVTPVMLQEALKKNKGILAEGLHQSSYSMVDNNSLPARNGQPTKNINAHGQLDAEELEGLGIESLSDNLGAGGFTAVAYSACLGRLRQRDNIVAR